MARKTESLSYPTNPLEAIRELQELDAAPKANKAGVAQAPARNGPRRELATGSEVANATSNADAHATGSEKEIRPRKKRPAHAPAPIKANGESRAESPVASAMREILGKPYTFDWKKGPFTVSTVKIPTEISD